MVSVTIENEALNREILRLIDQAHDLGVFDKEKLSSSITAHNKEILVDDHAIQTPIQANTLFDVLKKASIRQELGTQASFQLCDHYYIDRFSKKLWIEGQEKRSPLNLTEKEVLILDLLVKANGNSVPRADLLQSVWGYHAEAETHTIETHIYRLRQKLSDYCHYDHDLITTEIGGYSLNLG